MSYLWDGALSLRLDVQVEGVQFMYDNLVVNTEQLRGGGEGAKGNGCILAHCMGLGKTLQVRHAFCEWIVCDSEREHAWP